MSFAAVMGFMQIAQIAIPLGIATVDQIKGLIKSAGGAQMTDVELNQICSLVFDDAVRRKALAIADALGTTTAPTVA